MIDLIIHPAARAEFQSAADWYAERSVQVAERFASKVEAAITAIRDHPDRYALIDDMHRMYLVDGFSYCIAYRLQRDRIEIVAIRHAAQDQDAWKDR